MGTSLYLGIMTALAGASLAWALWLRRRVRQQKALLLEQMQNEVTLEKRFHDLFENAHDIVYTHDLAGRVTSLNKAGERITGYSRDELTGKDFCSLLVPEQRPNARQWLDSLAGGGHAATLEVEIVTKAGSRVYLELSSRLIQRFGRPVEVQGIARDVTERKRVEIELQRAMDAVEAASRSKDQFLANVSHEIRTPLNGIFGMTELALDTPLTPEQREYLMMTRRSTATLLELINDILDFSKMEAGKFRIEQVTVDLPALLDDLIYSFAMRAHQKGLEVICLVDDDVPAAIIGDPIRLRQVLANLLENAIKFTERGEVQLAVSRDPQDAGPDAAILRFAVRDTGIGIPAEKQQLVFEAFAQADGSTTRKYGGTGLGLAICSQLAALMEGSIELDSQPGKGSEFRFVAKFRSPPQAPLTVDTLPPAALPEALALVVDDSESSRNAVARLLRHWGLRAVTAADGREALDILTRSDSVRLILIDARLPGMGGIGLASGAAALPGVEQAAVVMMVPAGDRVDALRNRPEIAAFISKPVRPPELLNAVRKALSGSSRPCADSGLSILVAEDNPVNRRLIHGVLTRRGHFVEAVEDGRQALAALEKRRFDVVLLDLQMPQMDGFETVNAIRGRESLIAAGGAQAAGESSFAGQRHLPVIAITAHAMAGDRERCLQAGMDGYITKPVRAQELLDAILKFA